MISALPQYAARLTIASAVKCKDGKPYPSSFGKCPQDGLERINLADSRLRSFVEGYRSVRPLLEAELRLLPLFVRAHNLYWFARLLRSIADGALPGERPWTTELREALVRTMNGYRAGFERHPVRAYLS